MGLLARYGVVMTMMSRAEPVIRLVIVIVKVHAYGWSEASISGSGQTHIFFQPLFFFFPLNIIFIPLFPFPLFSIF